MNQYLELCEHVLKNGVKKQIVQVQVQLVHLVTKCDLIYKKDFHY